MAVNYGLAPLNEDDGLLCGACLYATSDPGVRELVDEAVQHIEDEHRME